MNWRCFFGFHKWAKWLDGTQKVRPWGETEWSTINIQVRSCEICNLQQRREV